jgi:hypothetical protein
MGAVQPHVVGGPSGAELLAARGQLPDEVSQGLVERVAAGLSAQDPDGVVRGALPVDPEVLGRRIEEREPGVVRGAHRVAVERAVERTAEAVADTSRFSDG